MSDNTTGFNKDSTSGKESAAMRGKKGRGRGRGWQRNAKLASNKNTNVKKEEEEDVNIKQEPEDKEETTNETTPETGKKGRGRGKKRKVNSYGGAEETKDIKEQLSQSMTVETTASLKKVRKEALQHDNVVKLKRSGQRSSSEKDSSEETASLSEASEIEDTTNSKKKNRGKTNESKNVEENNKPDKEAPLSRSARKGKQVMASPASSVIPKGRNKKKVAEVEETSVVKGRARKEKSKPEVQSEETSSNQDDSVASADNHGMNRRSRGRGKAIISDNSEVCTKKIDLEEPVEIKSEDNVIESSGPKIQPGKISTRKSSSAEANAPQPAPLKAGKKRKKHFKGLKYSFVKKYKAKKKPQLFTETLQDPALDTESVASEDVDAESVDSSSQDNVNVGQEVCDSSNIEETDVDDTDVDDGSMQVDTDVPASEDMLEPTNTASFIPTPESEEDEEEESDDSDNDRMKSLLTQGIAIDESSSITMPHSRYPIIDESPSLQISRPRFPIIDESGAAVIRSVISPIGFRGDNNSNIYKESTPNMSQHISTEDGFSCSVNFNDFKEESPEMKNKEMDPSLIKVTDGTPISSLEVLSALSKENIHLQDLDDDLEEEQEEELESGDEAPDIEASNTNDLNMTSSSEELKLHLSLDATDDPDNPASYNDDKPDNDEHESMSITSHEVAKKTASRMLFTSRKLNLPKSSSSVSVYDFNDDEDAPDMGDFIKSSSNFTEQTSNVQGNTVDTVDDVSIRVKSNENAEDGSNDVVDNSEVEQVKETSDDITDDDLDSPDRLLIAENLDDVDKEDANDQPIQDKYPATDENINNEEEHVESQIENTTCSQNDTTSLSNNTTDDITTNQLTLSLVDNGETSLLHNEESSQQETTPQTNGHHDTSLANESAEVVLGRSKRKVREQTDEKTDAPKSKRNHKSDGYQPLAIAAPKSPQQGGDEAAHPEGTQSVLLADPKLMNVLCKCSEVDNPRAEYMPDGLYCQAIESFDGRMIGCCNRVTTANYVRVSGKIPFMLLCSHHLVRLRHHNCCPGCGLFCTQGMFYECRWGYNRIRHHYHKLCGLPGKGEGSPMLCPHCGTDKPAAEVHLELKLSRKPVIYLKQHQEKKGTSARMSWKSFLNNNNNIDTDVSTLTSDEDDVSLNLKNNITVTTNNNILGDRKEKIRNAIQQINMGKTSSHKPSPKSMYWACKNEDVEKLLNILIAGLNPNVRVKEYGNQTGLHAASNYGSVACVHVLVLAKAKLDLTDSNLNTPLMTAIINQKHLVVKYLIQAGASLQAKSRDGMTCLHLAAKAGALQSCQHILDSGRVSRNAVNEQDEGGWTPLVWASENKHTNVVRFLLERGGNPQLCDVEQNTALHWAAFSGSTQICGMMLDRGCSLRSMNVHGDTPLHIAARRNHEDAVVLLLSRGASLEVLNKKGLTPMSCAIPDSDVHMQLSLNHQIHTSMNNQNMRVEKILCSDIAAGKEQVPIPCVNDIDDEDIAKNYLYIADNCEANNVNIDRTITSLKWCNCEDGCSSNECDCGQLNFQCWYDTEGRLLSTFNYQDPPMIFECNRACGCNKLSCNNRVVQHGITAHLQLFRTPDKGWGVRTLKGIPKGSYVCEYVGEIITDLEADQRQDDSYLFDLDNRDSETYCIDARSYGNVARFINHLCKPNLTPVKLFIDHQDLVFPRIAFFANRDIEPDEELGFDYGEKFWIIKYKHFTCSCGLEECKYSKEKIQHTLDNYNKRLKELQEMTTAI